MCKVVTTAYPNGPKAVEGPYPGDQVMVGRNDAKVTPGSVGVVAKISPDTGLPIVDVDGRGRVALTRDSLTVIADSERSGASLMAEAGSDGRGSQESRPAAAEGGDGFEGLRPVVEAATGDRKGWSQERRENHRRTWEAKRLERLVGGTDRSLPFDGIRPVDDGELVSERAERLPAQIARPVTNGALAAMALMDEELAGSLGALRRALAAAATSGEPVGTLQQICTALMQLESAIAEIRSRASRVVHVNDNVADAVYVGRRYPRRNLADSPFANPFRIGRDGNRDTMLARYRQHALASPSLLRGLPELRDKPLACWCRRDGDRRPGRSLCHGDVLIQLLEQHNDDELRALADRLETSVAMRTATYWVVSVPILYLSAAQRLDEAIASARGHFPGGLPDRILVHPETARGTPAREGLELVPVDQVGQYNYCFPTKEREVRAAR